MIKRQINRKLIMRLLILAFLIFLIAFSLSVLTDLVGHKRGESVRIAIQSGSSTAEIASVLEENDIIRYPLWFRLASKLGRHDGKYQQGNFRLNEHCGYKKVFETLKNATNTEELVSVTIPEGSEIYRIAEILEEKGKIPQAEFYDAVENGTFSYDFLADIPERKNRLEGYLFPDTYLFRPGESASVVVNMMLARFDEIYTEAYKQRAKELSMTDDQIITLASVIEREAMGEVDRKRVAGVFHNRLKNKQYPYFESCATVQYILQERKTVLSVSDTNIDSPYNTYRNPGLPVGPIASPGKESIEAALYPEETKDLFFVLDSNGVHRFAETYEEHLQNMNR